MYLQFLLDSGSLQFPLFQPGFMKLESYLRLVGFVVGHNKFMSYE